MSMMRLHELRPGQRAAVRAMDLTGSMRRRLRDIGLIEGTAVTCLGVSPGGDPKAFLIRGTVIALRAADSRKIRVELFDSAV